MIHTIASLYLTLIWWGIFWSAVAGTYLGIRDLRRARRKRREQ
jgi:hypothetical protein